MSPGESISAVIAFLALFLAFCGQLVFGAYKWGKLEQQVHDLAKDFNGLGRKLEERTRKEPDADR